VKDRLITLACALGALALFTILFVQPQNGFDVRRSVPRPTTAESRDDGYYAAAAWLRAANVRVESLRERIDTLPGRVYLPVSGNVLVVTLPGTDTYKLAEIRALQGWVRSGNTLLLLAALADNPQWSRLAGGVGVGDLKLLSGIDFEPRESPPGKPPSSLALVPNREHAYFSGVRRALAIAPPTLRQWTARIPYDGYLLALAHEDKSGQTLMWTRPLGEGRILVCALGSVFTDGALDRADNARLLSNIIGARLGRRGVVIFDDYHQGLSSAYDPEKFYADPRLHLTALVLLIVWLVWVLGATRLRIPIMRVAAPREADLVRAHGVFLARVLPRNLAVQRLFEHFFRRLAARSAPSQADPWDQLRALANVSDAQFTQLRRWHEQNVTGKRVPLVQLYNLLRRVEGQMP
jgi:hypothetical protein